MPLRPEHEAMAIKLRVGVAGLVAFTGFIVGEHAEGVFDPEPVIIEHTTSANTSEEDPHLPLQLMLTMAGTALGVAAAVRFVEYPDGQDYSATFTTYPRRPFM